MTEVLTERDGPAQIVEGAPPVIEVLFEEARQRRQRRLAWIGGGAAVALLVGVAAGALRYEQRVVSTPASRPPAQRAAASCPPSSLRAGFDGAESGLAGSVAIGFELQNVGSTSCAVGGHPSAVFYDPRGRDTNVKVGAMGALIDGRLETAAPRIVLLPGQHAYTLMIMPVCTYFARYSITSMQLVLGRSLIPGRVTAGRGHNQPYGIGGACRPGDPGTNAAFSPLETARDIS